MKRAKSNTKGNPPARSYSVPALDKGIDVIELLAGEKNGLLISEIAFRLRRSMSQIFRIVIALEQRQWVQKDRETSRYSITYRMMELAHRGTPAEAMSLVAAPVLNQLSKEIDQSCHIVVPAGAHGLVAVRQENAGHAGGFAMRLGAVVDLLSSAAGMLLLAYMDPADQLQVFRQTPAPWPMKKPVLVRRLARVREQGYELQPSLFSSGVTDISYPIHARAAKVVGALTVPYLRPAGKSAMALSEIRTCMEQAAKRISATLATIR